MVAAGIEFNAIEARLVIALTRVDERRNLGLYLLGRLHMTAAETRLQCAGSHLGGRGARRHHHVVHLADEHGAVLVDIVSDGGMGGDAIVIAHIERDHTCGDLTRCGSTVSRTGHGWNFGQRSGIASGNLGRSTGNRHPGHTEDIG